MNPTLFALGLLLLGSSAAIAAPSLKGDITVVADIVTVGDMFDNAGALSETAIFRAPAPGTTGVVPLADVQHAAELVGLTSFDNVGFTRVRVVRASTRVDASLFGRLINENLASRGVLGAGITAEPHFDIANINLAAERSDNPATLTDLRYVAETGAFTARFQVAGIDEPVSLTGTVQLMTTAPRLVATVPAGTILQQSDFEMAAVPVATADAGGYADIGQLIGKQLLRQSRAGMMLKTTDVSEPTVVTRNSLVTVVLKSGPMTLSVKGQALSTAAAGEPVDVLNIVSKKILHGVARADGTVDIVTATSVASL